LEMTQADTGALPSGDTRRDKRIVVET